jgi:protein-disulfide isomerase
VSAVADLALPVDPDRDHWRGGEQAAVTIVEYGDYQCPYSRLAFRAVQQLESELGPSLRYVYRHFPHPEKDHPWCEEAAAFVEAAALQDRFWDAHEIVFHRQKALDHESLLGYAEQLGLDVDRVVGDLSREDLAQRVRADFASAHESGLTGTPGLFVNGARYHGDSEYDQLEPVVSAVLSGSG